MAGLNVHDVARRLNVSEKTVYKWLKQGLIPSSRIGKTWIITEEAIDGLLNPSAIGRSRGATDSQDLPVTRRPTQSRSSQTSSAAPLQETVAQLSQLMSGAVAHGITGILGPRRVDPATPAAIASALEDAEGEVLLQGVGLREFFGDKDHAIILRRMATEDRPVSVRALLVNPTGQFARARTVAEDGEQFADDALFRAGPLFGDSWRSLNVIASLMKLGREARNFRLDVRFLDHWPSAYLVLTGDVAFVETYHFGRADSSVQHSTIDGLVPMLQVSADSDYYSLLRNHVDYLWNGTNPFVPSLKLEQIASSVQVQV